MPVSTSIHIAHCTGLIVTAQPRSVLDVGCGFGTWGFLCRTHLDVFPGRVQREAWEIRIDGVELFEPYIQPHQRWLYDNITIGDIRELAPRLPQYDLIIAGDVIEHLHKEEAERVLDHLYDAARKVLMVNIPLGEEGWDHPENHGNPGELHRSTWSPEDFLPYPNGMIPYDLPNGKYGVFWCEKDVPVSERVDGLLAAAERMLTQGRTGRAQSLLRRARALAPGDASVAVLLADAALRGGNMEEAVDALGASLGAGPETHRNYAMLASLLKRIGHEDEARAIVARLLALSEVDPAIRAEAESLLRRPGATAG